MKFVAGKWTQFGLSNKQWSEIREESGLPNEARARIEAALCLYREQRAFLDNHLRTRPQREKLRRIRELSDDLLTVIAGNQTNIRLKFKRMAERRLHGPTPLNILKILGKVYSHEVETVITLAREVERRNPGSELLASPAAKPEREIWPPRSPTPHEIYVGNSTSGAIQILCQIFLNIERLRLWAEGASGSSPRVYKEGPRRRSLSDGMLISALDEILFAYSGELISRSYKKAHLRRYVELCFRAVDPKIGCGSIDKAVQAHVRERLYATKTLEDLSGKAVEPLPMTQLLVLMSEAAALHHENS